MSALHEAVALAIADAMGKPVRADSAGLAPSELAAAAAACAVVLATVSSEIKPLHKVGSDLIAKAFNEGLDDALIVIERLCA